MTSTAEIYLLESYKRAEAQWKQQGFVGRNDLEALARDMGTSLSRLLQIFNGSDDAIAAITTMAQQGHGDASEMSALLSAEGVSADLPYHAIEALEYRKLREIIDANPRTVLDDPGLYGYPYYVPGKTYLYDIDWVRQTLQQSAHRLVRMREARTGSVAVLVGNGPSLNKTDLSLLEGRDVFISNYAINHPILSGLSTGLAVTNYLVAEQAPYQLMLDEDKWKVFPFWLRNTIIPDDKTIFLNARGGDLFFSKDPRIDIGWHSTVTYFWLQLLWHLGYDRVLMIGFDHSYSQPGTAKEGDVLVQKEADNNHFDPGYFKDKKWQAADVGKMEETYVLARQVYNATGREIINCTVGGHLEVFPRSSLEAQFGARAAVRVRASSEAQADEPRIAVVTPFWKGDQEAAERHWRLVNRHYKPNEDHYHVFKHGAAKLGHVTFPRIVFAEIERRFPLQSTWPHPAGPNLAFVFTLFMLKDAGYSHFFWLEPDCVPTRADWLEPFRQVARQYPEQAIIGTGGGTVEPGKTWWKHHFAGCSLYNIDALLKLDWQRFVQDELSVSFDVWMSVNLGYIKLGEVDDADTTETIIFGDHRYKWEVMNKPAGLVTGMFEHWRPEKFLSKTQLAEFLRSEAFGLFHAIKDEGLVRDTFRRGPRSATTIVINYNNERFIEHAIESALEQQGVADVDYQVIVVDDGSTDHSAEIIQRFGDRIDALMLSHGQLNANLNQQRGLIEAMALARGEVILLLDGDDTFGDEKVRKVLDAFDDPDVVMVQHALATIDDDNVDLGQTAKFFPATTIRGALYLELNRTNFFQPTSGLAFRREYLELAASRWLVPDGFQNTWFDVRLTRFAYRFGRVESLPATLGAWRRHGGSDSVRQDNLNVRMQEHHDWFNHFGHDFGLVVDFEQCELGRNMARTDPFAPLSAASVLQLMPDGDVVADGATGQAGFARGRIAAYFVDLAESGVRTAAFDLLVVVDHMEDFDFKAPHAGSHEYGYLYLYVPAVRASADAVKALVQRVRQSSGRRVYAVLDEFDWQAADKQAKRAHCGKILTSFGYASIHPAADTGALIQGQPQVEQQKAGNLNVELGLMDLERYARDRHAHIDETQVVSWLLDHRRGDNHIMLDAGGHYGESAMHFANKGWRVFCFEPDPANRQKLLERLGSRENVSVDPRALGEKEELAKPFFTSEQSTGISGLSAFHDSHQQAGTVDVTTVARAVDDLGIEHVDFLKIDVEGFDYSVLKGVPWDVLSPDAVECEFEDAKTVPLGHTWQDIADFLVAKGYTVYVSEWHPIIRYGVSHDWLGLRRYPCQLSDENGWGNLLAFREDPGSDQIKSAINACVRVAPPAASKPADKPAAVEAAPAAQPRRSRLTYASIAEGVKRRSHTLFRMGQLVMWSLRTMTNRPLVSIAWLVVLVASSAAALYSEKAGFAFGAFALLWLLAGFGIIAASVAQKAITRLIEHVHTDITISTREAAKFQDRHLAEVRRSIGELAAQLDKIATDAENGRERVVKDIMALEREIARLKDSPDDKQH